MNELLDQKDIELRKKVEEADEWVRRYEDLQSRLTLQSPENPVAVQARNDLQEGRLAEAGAALDILIATAQPYVESLASFQFGRGQVFAMQFNYVSALPHFEFAARLAPQNLQYAEGYAYTLFQTAQYEKAEKRYAEIIETYKSYEKITSIDTLDGYQRALFTLAVVAQSIGKTKVSYRALLDTLEIQERLSQVNPTDYFCRQATTLSILAMLYQRAGKPSCAADISKRIFGIWQQQKEKNCSVYLSDLAFSAISSSEMLERNQDHSAALGALQLALDTFREDFKVSGKRSFGKWEVDTLLRIAIVQLSMRQNALAKKSVDEAMDTHREIRASPPHSDGVDDADLLETASNIYRDLGDSDLAERYLRETIQLRTEFLPPAEQAPRIALASTWVSLGNLFRSTHRNEEARAAFSQALASIRDLGRVPHEFRFSVYNMLGFAAIFAEETGDHAGAEALRQERIALRKRAPKGTDPGNIARELDMVRGKAYQADCSEFE